MRSLAYLALAGTMAIAGCKGDKGPAGAQGPAGPQGPPGPGGTSVGTIQGTVTAAVGGAAVAGATVVTVPPSSSASSSASGAYAIATVPIGVYSVQVSATGFGTKTVADVSVVAGGTATVDVALDPPVVTTGAVSGAVVRRSAANAPVAGANVYLVDADALAGSPSEWPLEQLAGASPYHATTAADGSYALSGVTAGRYFVYVEPAAGDLSVFPGGDRAAVTVNADATTTSNVTLSQRAPGTATYVGSSTCLLCHQGTVASDKTGWKRTLHALVYRRPGVASANQDLSQLPGADAPLAFFVDGNPRDNTGAGDGLGLRISQASFSAFPATYSMLLGQDATGYFFQTETTDGLTQSDKYYVAFTFGGHGVYKQRWVTRARADRTHQPCAGAPGTPCTDWSYYILPLQYDERLQAGVEPFHPYNPANWGPPVSAGAAALVATQDKSFDLNCAGCHFTGTGITRQANGNFQARAVATSGGPLDYDQDGQADDISIGCEDCHGPGSAHVAAGGGLGVSIVQPRLLSAERENQLCTNCHTRGLGKGAFTGTAFHTEYPSKGTDALTFPYPGMSRSEFVADFHTDGLGTYSDDKKHSRQHHQQGNDFLKSKHFKNPFDLVTCGDCHDLHDRLNGPSLAASVADNKLCLDCHAPFGFGLIAPWTRDAEALAVSAHMTSWADMTAGYDPQNLANLGPGIVTGGVGRCTTCHMAKTAASQARFVHEQVNAGLQPAGPRIRGDISNHGFDVIWPAVSEALQLDPTAGLQKNLPNSCGSCHNSLVGASPKYTY